MRKQDSYRIARRAIAKNDPPGKVRRIDPFVPEIEAGIEKDVCIAVVIGLAFIQRLAFQIESLMDAEIGEGTGFL